MALRVALPMVVPIEVRKLQSGMEEGMNDSYARLDELMQMKKIDIARLRQA